MVKILRIEVMIAHSDWGEFSTQNFKVRTVENAATLVSDKTRAVVLEKIPKGRFCSVIIGIKEEELDE